MLHLRFVFIPQHAHFSWTRWSSLSNRICSGTRLADEANPLGRPILTWRIIDDVVIIPSEVWICPPFIFISTVLICNCSNWGWFYIDWSFLELAKRLLTYLKLHEHWKFCKRNNDFYIVSKVKKTLPSRTHDPIFGMPLQTHIANRKTYFLE